MNSGLKSNLFVLKVSLEDFRTLHYGKIFEYLSLWSEVQFLKIQKSQKSKKSKSLNNLDFTPETCQKIEKMLILNSRYRGIVVVEIVDFTLYIQGNSCYTGE